MATMRNKQLALALLTATLAACGGGSSGGGSSSAFNNLNVNVQSHGEGVLLSWDAVEGASGYTVYTDNDEISRSSPAAGTRSTTCSSSPCRVVTGGSGLQHVLVVAEGTDYRSRDLKVVAGAINDTGYTACAGSVDNMQSNNADCATALLAATQDGGNGRDADTGLLKSGAGPKGFDFTKLDEFGDELADNATEWRCVRDNVSGRIWEVKQTDLTVPVNADFDDDADLQDGRRTYNFSGSSPYLLTGEAADVTFSGSVDTLINLANTTGLCGKTDWRLPSLQELLGVLDYSTLDVSTTSYPQLGESAMKTTEAIGTSGGYETFNEASYLTATENVANNNAVYYVDVRSKKAGMVFKTGGQQLAIYTKDSNCVAPGTSTPAPATATTCAYAGHFARLVSY